MEITTFNELNIKFQNCISYLENQKEKRSHEDFKELILETWRGFCTTTIPQFNQRFHFSETEIADLNLLYDTKFEAYYENLLKEKNRYAIFEAHA